MGSMGRTMIASLFHALILFLLLAILECDGQAFKVGNHDYHCVVTKLNWDEANQNCKSLGRRMAMPKTSAGHSLIKQINAQCCKLAKVQGPCFVWLGARKEQWGNYWRWDDGTVFTDEQFAPGEPTGDGPCVNTYTLAKEGKLNDVGCHHKSI